MQVDTNALVVAIDFRLDELAKRAREITNAAHAEHDRMQDARLRNPAWLRPFIKAVPDSRVVEQAYASTRMIIDDTIAIRAVEDRLPTFRGLVADITDEQYALIFGEVA